MDGVQVTVSGHEEGIVTSVGTGLLLLFDCCVSPGFSDAQTGVQLACGARNSSWRILLRFALVPSLSLSQELCANKRPHIFDLIGVTRATRSQRAFAGHLFQALDVMSLWVCAYLVREWLDSMLLCAQGAGCSKSGWSFSCNSIRLKF